MLWYYRQSISSTVNIAGSFLQEICMFQQNENECCSTFLHKVYNILTKVCIVVSVPFLYRMLPACYMLYYTCTEYMYTQGKFCIKCVKMHSTAIRLRLQYMLTAFIKHSISHSVDVVLGQAKFTWTTSSGLGQHGSFTSFHVSFCLDIDIGSQTINSTSSSNVSILSRATRSVFASKLLKFRSKVDEALARTALGYTIAS